VQLRAGKFHNCTVVEPVMLDLSVDFLAARVA